ncbi:MAG: hypothetical protein JSS50_00365 [Proteobacteria bacterium]|nr:hypothetical protein [Pseudomonadota bacterium]
MLSTTKQDFGRILFTAFFAHMNIPGDIGAVWVKFLDEYTIGTLFLSACRLNHKNRDLILTFIAITGWIGAKKNGDSLEVYVPFSMMHSACYDITIGGDPILFHIIKTKPLIEVCYSANWINNHTKIKYPLFEFLVYEARQESVLIQGARKDGYYKKPLISDLRMRDKDGRTIADAMVERFAGVKDSINIPSTFYEILALPVDDCGNTLAHKLWTDPRLNINAGNFVFTNSIMMLENANRQRVIDVIHLHLKRAMPSHNLAFGHSHALFDKYRIFLFIWSIFFTAAAAITAAVLFDNVPNHAVATIFDKQLAAPLAMTSVSCLFFFAVGSYFMHETNARNWQLTIQRTIPVVLVAVNFYLVKYLMGSSLLSTLVTSLTYGIAGTLSFNSYGYFKSGETLNAIILLSCGALGAAIHDEIFSELASTTMLTNTPLVEGAAVFCISGATLVALQYVYQLCYIFTNVVYDVLSDRASL